MSLITGLFFLVLLLNQRWSPPLRLQAPQSSTFRITCDVLNIAVFCSESIECFPGTASKFFLKLLDTIPVAPIIIGIIVHFRLYIRCISIHKLLYFNFSSASFCTTFLKYYYYYYYYWRKNSTHAVAVIRPIRMNPLKTYCRQWYSWRPASWCVLMKNCLRGSLADISMLVKVTALLSTGALSDTSMVLINTHYTQKFS